MYRIFRSFREFKMYSSSILTGEKSMQKLGYCPTVWFFIWNRPLWQQSTCKKTSSLRCHLTNPCKTPSTREINYKPKTYKYYITYIIYYICIRSRKLGNNSKISTLPYLNSYFIFQREHGNIRFIYKYYFLLCARYTGTRYIGTPCTQPLAYKYTLKIK